MRVKHEPSQLFALLAAADALPQTIWVDYLLDREEYRRAASVLEAVGLLDRSSVREIKGKDRRYETFDIGRVRFASPLGYTPLLDEREAPPPPSQAGSEEPIERLASPRPDCEGTVVPLPRRPWGSPGPEGEAA
jgi:hypothetical protein